MQPQILIAVVLHDETRPSLSGQIGPHPLHKDTHPKTRLSQKLQMDRGPDKPRQETTEANLAALQNCKTLAHNGQVSFVKVTERSRRLLSFDAQANEVTRITSLLHCYLRIAR